MNSKLSSCSKWSLLLGNLFEHYDAALFNLLSPFLAPQFFPDKDPLTALILTYCIIPLGMIARPFGSLFFGYIGDTQGREKALFLALMGIAIVTSCMAFIPTYHQVGYLAPLLLSGGRILQNFCAAGETTGGAITLLENSPDSQKDLFSSLFNASTIGGILLATCGVSILYAFENVEHYWRWLYLFGGATAIFAFFLRMKMRLPPSLTGPPSFSLSLILNMFKSNREAMFTIALAAGFSYATYTLAFILMNGFIPLVTNLSQAEMMHLNTLLLGVDFLLLPLFGWMANRFSRTRMMVMASTLSLFSGIPLFLFLHEATLVEIILIRLQLVILGVWFCAPFYAWAQELVPASQRYTVISFAYAIGSQCLGGPTAAISLWLYQKTEWTLAIGSYWMLLALCVSLLIARQTKKIPAYI